MEESDFNADDSPLFSDDKQFIKDEKEIEIQLRLNEEKLIKQA